MPSSGAAGSASTTDWVWVRASRQARVPNFRCGQRHPTTAPSGPGRRSAGASSSPADHPADRGDRTRPGRIQVEQLAQRLGVGVALRRRGQFLDPDGRRVQHLVHRPAHRAGQFGPDRRVQAGQPAVQPQHLGVDHLGRAGPQRGDGRRDRERLLVGQVAVQFVGHDRVGGARSRRGTPSRRSCAAPRGRRSARRAAAPPRDPRRGAAPGPARPAAGRCAPRRRWPRPPRRWRRWRRSARRRARSRRPGRPGCRPGRR